MKFRNLFKLAIVSTAVVSLSGCFERIQTGEVGIRIDMSKQIQQGELLPGSWNQTLVGDVMTFPVKDITINLENKAPMTSDNSALADFDITVVYAINPSSVSELYSTKSKSFHTFDEKENDIYLMYNYISTLVNNSSYKAIREFKALEVADNRAKIELMIRDSVNEQLKAENLDTSITLTVVQIRNVAPNAEIMKSATDYVRAQNELKIKQTEVDIAKKEAERMAALSTNSSTSISYMEAQAKLTIAQAIKEGKVQTIIVPSNMTSLMLSK